MVAAFKDVYTYLTNKQLAPKLHVLDNECSKVVHVYVKYQNTRIQLVEPHNHCVNAAETAVKATEYHLLGSAPRSRSPMSNLVVEQVPPPSRTHAQSPPHTEKRLRKISVL